MRRVINAANPEPGILITLAFITCRQCKRIKPRSEFPDAYQAEAQRLFDNGGDAEAIYCRNCRSLMDRGRTIGRDR